MLISEIQSEPGAALTEPENEISQNYTGSRAEAEKLYSHPNVTRCNLSLCMTSASCGLILFEDLIKGVVVAIISVAWSS